MRRRTVVSMLMGWAVVPAILSPLPLRAQQAARVSRVGLLADQPFKPLDAFRKKLAELGHGEGQNLALDFRYAEGKDDRYPALAAELAALPVDVIVTWGTPAALAAKRATTRIPIVFAAGDAINTGIVSSLSHPEGNITGFIAVNIEMEAKRLELLKDVVPRLSRVAVLSNALNPINRTNLDTVRRAAQELSLTVDAFEIRGPAELQPALRRIVDSHPDAALIAPDLFLLSQRLQVVDAMGAGGIPAIYPFHEFADVGGLLIYGADHSVLFQQVASYVDRILRGDNPANLPVQQATVFELIVNLKTAAALGLTVPPVVLTLADEVVE